MAVHKTIGDAKTFLAQALDAAATRAGHTVLFRRADLLLRELGQSRADHSFETVFRRYLAPDLLVIDDFGLQRLNRQQSEDLYALVIERHRRSSFIVTSNRDVSEWVGLFADPSSLTPPLTASPMAPTSSSSMAPATELSSPPAHPRRRP